MSDSEEMKERIEALEAVLDRTLWAVQMLAHVTGEPGIFRNVVEAPFPDSLNGEKEDPAFSRARAILAAAALRYQPN